MNYVQQICRNTNRLIPLFLIVSQVLLISCNHKNKSKPVVEFSLKEAPFSIPESGMSVCDNYQTRGVAITDLRYTWLGKDNSILKFLYISGGDTINAEATGTPGELLLFADSIQTGNACFENYKKFRLKGERQPMVLMPDKKLLENGKLSIVPRGEGVYHLQKSNQFGISYHVVTCYTGSLVFNENKKVFVLQPSAKGDYEISIEETDSTWTTSTEKIAFNSCVKTANDSYKTFLAKMPALPEKYAEDRKLAAYILWMSEIDHGYYQRPAMLMSKNWMHFIWSWDHCFNAMAASYHLPEVAWDNLMVIFDGQKENGQLPNRYGYVPETTDYRFRKPPIHGWALGKIMKNIELTTAQLTKIYIGLTRWTNYWFNEWDIDNNGLPEYSHGYDSGWDNATTFDIDGQKLKTANRESADLSAFLKLQMDMLHDLALKLGKTDEAKQWQQRSDKQLELMINNLWNGNKFVTRVVETGYVNEKSQSLMQFLPLLLGEKLPVDIRDTMIRNLKNGGFITRWGLATESVNSPLYGIDDYWRGSIWAPSTMIVVEGLNNCGETELAKDIAHKFCELCATNGFAENFDAKTGRGQRDLSYTWTASVFLILGHEYYDF